MTLGFDSKQEYALFLAEKFQEISKVQEFNIFCHCVTDYTRYFIFPVEDADKDLQMKIENILRVGLNLDGTQNYGRYGSINGCARFFGEANAVDVTNIVNYDYFSRGKTKDTIIIAIPKFININGKYLEFSSLNGTMEHKSQHDKDCVFDLVKGSFLPVEFILGYQKVEKLTGQVIFSENDKHFSKLSTSQQDELMQKFVDGFERVVDYCKRKYEATTLETILKIMTDDHMATIADDLDQP